LCSSRHIAPALLLLAGCAAGEPSHPTQRHWLTVWNRCSVSPEQPNFYELLEVRAHDDESYLEADNLLDEPLAVGARTALRILSGQFVTVIRRRNTGESIALTTARALPLPDNCGVLEVFDDGFRFVRDLDSCIPDPDGGPPGPDGGGGD